MTPAGRAPRSDSNADKKVTIRLTADVLALLEKAAEPANLSPWIRETLFSSRDVLALQPTPDRAQPIAAAMTDVRTALDELMNKALPERTDAIKPAIERFRGSMKQLFLLTLETF